METCVLGLGSLLILYFQLSMLNLFWITTQLFRRQLIEAMWLRSICLEQLKVLKSSLGHHPFSNLPPTWTHPTYPGTILSPLAKLHSSFPTFQDVVPSPWNGLPYFSRPALSHCCALSSSEILLVLHLKELPILKNCLSSYSGVFFQDTLQRVIFMLLISISLSPTQQRLTMVVRLFHFCVSSTQHSSWQVISVQ